MKLLKLKPALALVLYSFVTVATAEELVVIVNPKNTSSRMTADEVEKIFLGKSSSLPGGGMAIPVDQSESSAVRDAFYQKAAGKDPAQVKAVWSRLVFSGKGTPPKSLPSSAEVKKFVASDPNAIGYIEKSAADASVKVVLSLP